jgi:hypothetical protein
MNRFLSSAAQNSDFQELNTQFVLKFAKRRMECAIFRFMA